ncbi:MAG: peptidyl-prolyl cis-trans isomerase [Deltaproteobacteria bacterium]|nr:peptidyl-prolyl cis-trans isomerase [Deltaproteobacteria bacterium]
MLRHLAFLVAAALAAGCGSSEPQRPELEVVARVNGEPIEIAEPVQGAAHTPAAALGRVDAAVARHLTAGEATRRGLSAGAASGPLSVRDEEKLRDALFASMRDSLELGEDELRAHYEKTRVRYVAPQVSLRRQAFASESDARAEDRRLGVDGRIAAEGSDRIGPAPVDGLPTTVMPEALTLAAAGQRVVLMRDGRWWLVELEESHTAEPLPFEAVRPRVEQSLRMLRAQADFRAEIARLRNEAQIEIEGSALANTTPAPDASKPVSGPDH